MKKLTVMAFLLAANAFSASLLQIITADDQVCARFATGTLQCWGGNNSGELGLGSSDNPTTPQAVAIDAEKKVVSVAMGNDTTCALLDDNSLKCWGDNSSGQLGIGQAIQSYGTNSGETPDKQAAVNLGTTLKIKKVAVGSTNVCVLFEDGSIKCWGDNSTGELGLGDNVSRGTDPSQMGAALAFLNLGTHVKAIDLVAGGGFECAQTDDHSFKCWGAIPGAAPLARNVGLVPADMGDALPTLSFGSGKILQLVAGSNHVCALLDDGSVRCFGADPGGIGEMGGFAPSTIVDATLLPVPLSTGLGALQLSTSAGATCALLENNAMKCWGDNSNAQLGLGDSNSRGITPTDMGDNLPFVDLGPLAIVTQITIGNTWGCAILKTGDVKCWGNNAAGATPGTMGAALLPVVFPSSIRSR